MKKIIRFWNHKLRPHIWCELRTPDGNSSRHWSLMFGEGFRGVGLPIHYTKDNKFWMKVERWMEHRLSYNYFDISW